jgi:dTMP kinase
MFITFEGIDGCGKTTQLELIKNFLIENKYQVVTTREPGGTELSEQIRNILLNVNNKINSISELLLFEAARSQLVETVIKPALENNCIVLCDRFYDSSVAYQGYGRGLNLKNIAELNMIATNGIIPDITFFLDVPFQVAFERRKSEKKDRMETVSIEFSQKVIDGYRKIATLEPDRFIIIDASSTQQNTFEQILKILNEKLRI